MSSRALWRAAALLFMVAAAADEEIAPGPAVTSSPSGRYYFRMLPAGKDAPARGRMMQVQTDGSDRELWRLEGWHARTVFVTDDPNPVLVRLGNWPRGKGPKEEDLAVAFYREGKVVKSYSTKDLIRDASRIECSVSHYSFVDWHEPPRLDLAQDGWRFELRTSDGILYRFDTASGRIVEAQPRLAAVKDEETAKRIAEAIWSSRFGAEQIAPEKPLNAKLAGGVWTVSGSLPEGHHGGVATIRIRQEDGRILSLIHGQ